MKNQLLLFLLLCGTFIGAQAQAVAKRIVVEHFTNTRCGICANRNPGFFNNLANHPDVLHLSVHPSSPYPSCVLHQANTTENNARTNYHGVFGGTPRLVVQGTALSSGANYGSAAIFTPYQSQTTPVSMTLWQTKNGNAIDVSLVIKAEEVNNIGMAKLFLAVAEDTVFYNAPNGESRHYNVFRKTFTGAPQGMDVAVPANPGDSIVITASMTAEAAWVFERAFAIAILNDAADRSVIQATASNPSDNTPLPVVSTREVNTLPVGLFPNPVKDVLNIQLEYSDTPTTLRLLDSQGRVVLTQTRAASTLDMGQLPNGIYWLELEAEGKTASRKVVKQ